MGRMDRAGGIVASRSWHEGQVVDEHVTLEEIPATVREKNLVWIDLRNPTEQELGAVMAELGVHSYAVEDALAPFERPKLIRHETHLFFTAYGTAMVPPRPRGAGAAAGVQGLRNRAAHRAGDDPAR